MNTITTATGKSFPVCWCGFSRFDLALRFEVNDMDLSELFQIVTNEAETQTLTHSFDEKEEVLTGYTRFGSFIKNQLAGSVIVALYRA